MDIFSDIEQETLDINWFFTDGGYIAFVASGGGILPKSAALKMNFEKLWGYFHDLPDISGVEIVVQNEEKYLKDFIEMAKKGLFAFDKTIPNQFRNSNYHLVARPLRPISVSELPDDILSIINHSRKHISIKDISSFIIDEDFD